MMPRRAAVIDIGTNSVKIVVGKRTQENSVQILADSVMITRLGEGVSDTGVLSLEAQKRTLKALDVFVKLAWDLEAQQIKIVSTSAVRDARNRDEFVGQVQQQMKVPLEILSGDEEGRLSYLSAVLDQSLGIKSQNLTMMDVGGGSSEFVFGTQDRVLYSISVQMGAVRLTEQAISSCPVSDADRQKAITCADEVLRAALDNRHVEQAIGIGGSAVNLARIIHKLPRERTREVHGASLSIEDIRKITDLLCSFTTEQRQQLIGLDPERADIIPAGAIILERAMTILEAKTLTISTHGLRYGLLYEMLKN